RIRSGIDILAFRRAIRALLDRHSVLRTVYLSVQGRPVQVAREACHLLDVLSPFSEASLSTQCFRVTASAHLTDGELRQRVSDAAHEPFDLEHGPVFRVHVFRRSDQDHVLLMSAHHIAADFWSLVVLMTELRLLYPVAVLYPDDDPV